MKQSLFLRPDQLVTNGVFGPSLFGVNMKIQALFIEFCHEMLWGFSLGHATTVRSREIIIKKTVPVLGVPGWCILQNNDVDAVGLPKSVKTREVQKPRRSKTCCVTTHTTPVQRFRV